MTGNLSTAASSPRSVFPDKGDPEDANLNSLYLELAPFGLERLDDYGPGGQHPIHLGDILGPGHRGPYRVVHKLGNGGHANVWLCRDVTAADSLQYIALKVLVSDASNEDCQERRAGKLQRDLDLEGNQDAAQSITLPPP